MATDSRSNQPPSTSTPTWFLATRSDIQGPALFDEACLDYYQLRLLNSLKVYRVALHAYVLQPDEVWLLLTPELHRSAFAMLDHVHECYSEYFNNRFERKVAVFRGAPREVKIESAELLLDCHKLVESWPLLSGAAKHPGLYRWSSYSANAFGGPPRFLTRHRFFQLHLADGEKPLERYREFIAAPFNANHLADLRRRLLLAED